MKYKKPPTLIVNELWDLTRTGRVTPVSAIAMLRPRSDENSAAIRPITIQKASHEGRPK